MTRHFDNKHNNPLSPPNLWDNPKLLEVISLGVKNEEDRRRAFRPGILSINVDGIDIAQFDAKEGACTPFQISSIASSIEICGKDARGDVFLALFPLPDLYEMAGEEKIVFGKETGPTYTLALSPVRDENSSLIGGIATVFYSEGKKN